MRSGPLPCLALALAVLAGPGVATARTGPAPLAITGVRVVDVERGHTLGPRTVVVADGRIVAVTTPPRARIPGGARRVDGRGQFLVPGLVDMHVHLFNNTSGRAPNEWAFRLFVAHGVTSVREMGARSESLPQVVAWNRARADGTLVAPRVAATAVVVRGADGVAAAAAAGATAIKVFSDLPAEQLPAIVSAAKVQGLPVVGHAPARLSLGAAGALRTNEHLMQVFEACATSEDVLLAARRGLDDAALGELQLVQEAQAHAGFSAGRCRRVARGLARRGQAQVPTLVLDAMPRDGRHATHPLWLSLRGDERARWDRILGTITPRDRALERARLRAAPRIVAALQRGRVPILAGTDAPMPEVYPGLSLHEELALLVAAGATPAQALRAATLAPAQSLREDGTSGSIAVGKRADLVLLAADPLHDIGNTRRIVAVVLDGRLLARADLDALLRPTP